MFGVQRHMINYIYFKGGSFGDLIGLLVNNGATLENEDQKNLKTSAEELQINSLPDYPIDTIVGHNSSVLNLGLNNYQIIINDPKIRDLAARRFANANKLKDISKELGHYYPRQLHKNIENLPLSKQIDLLAKKYEYDNEYDTIKLDLSCVLDYDKLIDLLSGHFDFDHDIAKNLYSKWYKKEERNNFFLNHDNTY